jgi:hypothetical protein
MNPIFKKVFKGKVLFVDKEFVFYYYKGKIFKSSDDGKIYNEFLQIPKNTILDTISYKFNLLERLLRKGVHHLNVDNESCFAIFNKQLIQITDRKIFTSENFRGSRPLSFELKNKKLFFGEYRSNEERSEIIIFQKKINEKLNTEIKIKGIRHIHGIYSDPYSTDIYITTGDDNNESILYKTNFSFDKFEKVLEGSQQTRMIKLLFDQEFIYFGTDTPHEKNFIYRLNRIDGKLTKLAEVGSSVFHGSKVKNWFFFSTAIEPSSINKTTSAELWASPDGINWKCISKWKKDSLPMKYFQYGQLFFPNGEGDNKNLWFTPFSTKNNNQTFKVSIDEIEKVFKNLK